MMILKLSMISFPAFICPRHLRQKSLTFEMVKFNNFLVCFFNSIDALKMVCNEVNIIVIIIWIALKPASVEKTILYIKNSFENMHDFFLFILWLDMNYALFGPQKDILCVFNLFCPKDDKVEEIC